jgi:hypothetical protein
MAAPGHEREPALSRQAIRLDTADAAGRFGTARIRFDDGDFDDDLGIVASG